MERKFDELYTNICEILNNAPEEGCCSDAEEEVYADMANLKNSLEKAGLVFISDKKKQ